MGAARRLQAERGRRFAERSRADRTEPPVGATGSHRRGGQGVAGGEGEGAKARAKEGCSAKGEEGGGEGGS